MISLRCLLLLCLLPLLASGILLPPRNLSLTSENFKHILTWEEPNNGSAILYNVEYFVDNNRIFNPADNCSNITTRRCDLTKVFTEIFRCYRVQVRSVRSVERSDPSLLSSEFSPLSTVVGPPIVDVVAAGSGINVSISLPISYLWNKAEGRFDSILKAYPAIDYEIYLEPSTEFAISKAGVSVERVTIPIPSLFPSTTYCVSVSMQSENMEPSVTSPKKCAVTKGSQVKGDNKVYWIVAGVILFIILLLLLIFLDQAGYISKKRIFTPNVLASLPDSRSLLHGSHQLAPLILMTPVEAIHSLENEDIDECPARIMDSAPYIAHNLNAENVDQQEAPNQGDGLPTIEHSAGPLSEPTEVVLSEDLSVESMMTIDDSISPKHNAIITLPERSVEVPTVGNGWNPFSPLANGFDDSLSLSLRHNCISIDLNSISLGDSVDHWKSLPRVASPKGSSSILASHSNGDAVNISLLCSVRNEEAPAIDNLDFENNEDGDEGSDLKGVSDYINR
ncbi:interferon alpha/beta receptor 2-like [Mantella aurantiaca]